ncbi:MAG TPA: C45 family peptidase [Phycisphaerae bacterium]|nr:C45 family peptidase [Phycisphaerae bacterium]
MNRSNRLAVWQINRIRQRLGFWCVASAISVFAFPYAVIAAEPSKPINGELREIKGVPVLRIWGTPREQGYAQGYLLAPQGIKLLDGYLRGLGGPDAIKAYEITSFMVMQRMKIPQAYKEELEGIIAGGKARLGDKLTVPALGRALEYRDLLAINCIPYTARMGCSSFAAWGPLTEKGHTLVGRNLDWVHYPALDGQQIVVVRIPPDGNKTLAWVSVTWPCFIGCLTGMNAEGVTISIHDAEGPTASDPSRLAPRAMALREALEQAHAATALDDVARVLKSRTTAVGNNVPVAFPYDGKHASAGVFEYDGDLDKDSGVTLRMCESKSGPYAGMLTCTNHYLSRRPSVSCDRYEKIDRRLHEAASGHHKIGLPEAWQILKSSQFTGRVLTYHSVVFEPNEMRMHVAFAVGQRPAPENPSIELDVRSLLLESPPPRLPSPKG